MSSLISRLTRHSSKLLQRPTTLTYTSAASISLPRTLARSFSSHHEHEHSNVDEFGFETTDQSQERLFAEPPLKEGEKREVFDWERFYWLYVAVVAVGAVGLYFRPNRTVQLWAYEEALHTEERELKGRVITENHREKYED